MQTLPFLILFLLPSFSLGSETRIDEVVEGKAWYANRVETDGSATPTPLGESPREAIDVRGLGDTAWARGSTPSTGLPTPLKPEFDTAIENIDPSAALFRGDLNFLNWESVVGERCDSIRSTVDFYFLSHPEAIRQAIQKGFNLISLANNHAQDCNLGQSTLGAPAAHGPRMSSENLARLSHRRRPLPHPRRKVHVRWSHSASRPRLGRRSRMGYSRGSRHSDGGKRRERENRSVDCGI